jgi:hypothetical protein
MPEAVPKDPKCPGCGRPLNRVRQSPNSSLNRDQWESCIAGNWYCEHCKGSRGQTDYRYYWDRELIAAEPCPIEAFGE